MTDAPSRHSPQRPELQLKGARPPRLKLNKESHKISKQNVVPPPAAAEAKSRHHRPPPPPIIIYTESPTIIHVEPNEFMSVVQRLTGLKSTSSISSTINNPPPQSFASGGAWSPAPQMAGVPEWRETQFFDGDGDEMPQNSDWNETDFDAGLHGSMHSSSVLDVFNYLCDI